MSQKSGGIEEARWKQYKEAPKTSLAWKPTANNLNRLANGSGKLPKAFIRIRSFGTGSRRAFSMINYITRDGELSMESSDGFISRGKEANFEQVEYWQSSFDGDNFVGGFKAESKVKDKYDENNGPKVRINRDVMHMYISLPKERNIEEMEKLARGFGEEEFADNYEYVFALHDDTDNPHAHFVVNIHGFNEKKLNPRKADIAHWRGAIAKIAKERCSIDLDHSPCYARGVAPNSRSQGYKAIRERGEDSSIDNKIADAAKGDVDKGRIGQDVYSKHLKAKSLSFRKEVSRVVDRLVEYAAKKGDPKYSKIASKVALFGATLPTPKSEREQAANALLEKQKDRGIGKEKDNILGR